MENLVAESRSAQRHFAPADRAADGFRFPRNLHAGSRRQRLGRDPRAAPRLRRRRGSESSSPTPRALPVTPWPPASKMSLAVKALETGCVPPVANFKEVDPEFGQLNLSKGGAYPVEYALHLGAGFGSQISMTLLRWVKTKDGIRRSPNALGYAYRIADADCVERMAERNRRTSDRRTGSGPPHAAGARSRAGSAGRRSRSGVAPVGTRMPIAASTVAQPPRSCLSKPEPKPALKRR